MFLALPEKFSTRKLKSVCGF